GGCNRKERARRFLGAIINERATELRRQYLLRAGLGPHLWRKCGHVARVAALCRSGHRRIVWSRTDLTADRQPRPHRLPPNCILFGRAGWARWDAAGYAVVRVGAFAALLRQVAVTPPLPITIGARRPVSRGGRRRLVGLRFHGSTPWEPTVLQIVDHVIVGIVIDDGRKRTITLPRIIALWRISPRWRIGLSRRVVLRRSLPSRRSE